MKPALTLLVTVSLLAVGCDANTPAPTTKRDDPAVKPATVKPNPPPAKQTPVRPLPVDPPAPAKPATFDELWKEVGIAVAAMEKAGAEDLKSSEKLLTASEKLQRDMYLIPGVQHNPQGLASPEVATQCFELRMQPWVDGITARAGYADNEFKNVARVLFPPTTNPKAVALSASVWTKSIYRHQVAQLILSDTKTDMLSPMHRDIILNMGGESWLKR